MDVFSLFARLSLDTKDYENNLDRAEKDASSFGSKLKSGLGTAGKVAGAAIGVIAAGATALTGALVKGVSDVASYGDNIDKMSQKLGMSAEAYQEWDAIMRHAGASIETMQAGMKTLATAAESGNKAFAKLGFTRREIAEMDQEELFAATITALQNIEDGTERTYLASQLLGRGATELGALLNMTAEETEEMRQRVHELGGVMTDEAVKETARFQDTLQDLQTAFGSVKRGIITDFLPSITTVMDGLTKLFSGDGDSGVALISDGIGTFVDKLSGIVPLIAEIGGRIIPVLMEAIISNFPTLFNAAQDLMFQLVDAILDNLPQIAKTALSVIITFAKGIAKSLPRLVPTIVDVVLEIVEILTSPDTLTELVDAALQIIVGLGIGLINALPALLEKIPVIIGNLIEALLGSIPLLIRAAIDLVIGLAKGLLSPEGQSAMFDGGIQLVGSLIRGIISYFTQIFGIGKEIFSQLKDGFLKFKEDPKQWGKDLLDNFINGIKERVQKLKDTVSNVGKTIRDFLGFSEPKLGPLSNFHTYAPDMMELFAKGIRDNENVITDQVRKSFDFGDISVAPSIGTRSAAYYGGTAYGYNGAPNITINVDGARYQDPEELADGIAEAVSRELQNMTERSRAAYA